MEESISTLYNKLAKLLHENKDAYLIAGVGTELRNDDRVGLIVCKMLQELGYNCIQCEFGLETCLEDIIKSKAKTLIIIDGVVAENTPPGSIILAKIDDVSGGFLATTHNIPIRLLIKYLRNHNVALETYIVGIQIKNIDFGTNVSQEVLEGAKKLVKILSSIMKQ